MLTLNQLTKDFSPDLKAKLTIAIGAFGDIPFKHLKSDSRQVKCGDVFILLKSQSLTSTSLDITSNDIEKYSHYLLSVAQTAVFILSEIDPRFFVNVIKEHPVLNQPIIYFIRN